MVKIVSNINAGSGLEWSLEVIINVVDLGGHTSVTSSDDSIRPTLTYDEHGYKQRNLEEAKRYYSILAKGAAKYIKQKELELGSEAVAYIETQNSEESGAGYVFFTVDDQAFSVDLRVAEVQYSDKRNMARDDWAIKKLYDYPSNTTKDLNPSGGVSATAQSRRSKSDG